MQSGILAYGGCARSTSGSQKLSCPTEMMMTMMTMMMIIIIIIILLLIIISVTITITIFAKNIENLDEFKI